MAKLYSGFDKRFLDTHSSKAGDETGYIAWNVRTIRYLPHDKAKHNRGAVRGDLKFADCNRTINIDINANNIEEIDARIAKVGELIDSLQALKKGLQRSRRELNTWRRAPFIADEDEVMLLNGDGFDDDYF